MVAVAGGILLLCCTAICAYFVFTFRKQQLIEAHIGDFYGRQTEIDRVTNMGNNSSSDNDRREEAMNTFNDDLTGNNNNNNNNEMTTPPASTKRFSLTSYLKAAQLAVAKASGGAVTISLAQDGSFRIEPNASGPDPYAETGTESAMKEGSAMPPPSPRIGELRSDSQQMDDVYRNSLVWLQGDIPEHRIDDQQRDRLSIYHRNSVGRMSTGRRDSYGKTNVAPVEDPIEEAVIDEDYYAASSKSTQAISPVVTQNSHIQVNVENTTTRQSLQFSSPGRRNSAGLDGGNPSKVESGNTARTSFFARSDRRRSSGPSFDEL